MKSASRIKKNYEKKKKEDLRKKRIGFLKIILLMIFTSGVIAFFLKAEFFNIKNVEITEDENIDTSYIDYDEIGKYLSQYKGENYFLIRPEENIGNLYEISPYIKDIFVRKVFPNTIAFYFTEREPFIIVKKEDSCVILDSKAFVLEKEDKENDKCPKKLLEKEDLVLDIENLKIDFVRGHESTFFELYDIYNSVRVFEDQGYILKNIQAEDDLFIYRISENREVIISRQQDVQEQLKKFVIVSEQIKLDKLKFNLLDLRYERPVIKN